MWKGLWQIMGNDFLTLLNKTKQSENFLQSIRCVDSTPCFRIHFLENRNIMCGLSTPTSQTVTLKLREKIKMLFLYIMCKLNHSAFLFHLPQGKTKILERTKQTSIDHGGMQKGRKRT